MYKYIKNVIIIIFKINIFIPLVKIEIIRVDIKIILVYSPINKRAKSPDPYSTLNPETSSDSPSAKSNGLRFDSATDEIHHIMANGAMIRINQE